ncbi:MAG: hypothetical protein AAF802_01190 [Planctomycetota bacterium]
MCFETFIRLGSAAAWLNLLTRSDLMYQPLQLMIVALSQATKLVGLFWESVGDAIAGESVA